MSIIVNGNEFRTLEQPLFLNDSRVSEVYVDDVKVYPEYPIYETVINSKGSVVYDVGGSTVEAPEVYIKRTETSSWQRYSYYYKFEWTYDTTVTLRTDARPVSLEIDEVIHDSNNVKGQIEFATEMSNVVLEVNVSSILKISSEYKPFSDVEVIPDANYLRDFTESRRLDINFKNEYSRSPSYYYRPYFHYEDGTIILQPYTSGYVVATDEYSGVNRKKINSRVVRNGQDLFYTAETRFPNPLGVFYSTNAVVVSKNYD